MVSTTSPKGAFDVKIVAAVARAFAKGRKDARPPTRKELEFLDSKGVTYEGFQKGSAKGRGHEGLMFKRLKALAGNSKAAKNGKKPSRKGKSKPKRTQTAKPSQKPSAAEEFEAKSKAASRRNGKAAVTVVAPEAYDLSDLEASLEESTEDSVWVCTECRREFAFQADADVCCTEEPEPTEADLEEITLDDEAFAGLEGTEGDEDELEGNCEINAEGEITHEGTPLVKPDDESHWLVSEAEDSDLEYFLGADWEAKVMAAAGDDPEPEPTPEPKPNAELDALFESLDEDEDEESSDEDPAEGEEPEEEPTEGDDEDPAEGEESSDEEPEAELQDPATVSWDRESTHATRDVQFFEGFALVKSGKYSKKVRVTVELPKGNRRKGSSAQAEVWNFKDGWQIVASWGPERLHGTDEPKAVAERIAQDALWVLA